LEHAEIIVNEGEEILDTWLKKQQVMKRCAGK
jgi:hypothetical protein